MTERLRALLQGIGPGGVRGGVTILALTLSLLVLVVVVVWYALSYGQVEATSEPEITVVSENEPEDSPLIFGPGPSPELSDATSTSGHRRGIRISEMEVIGYLQYLPGTDFHCPGGGPTGTGLTKRVCRSSTRDNPTYEVTFLMNAEAVVAVVATAQDASEEEASKVLGEVAKRTLGNLGPLDPEAWVDRTISSGGQYSTDVAEVRLYGTEKTRTLEIVANAAPAERATATASRSSQTTERATSRPPR